VRIGCAVGLGVLAAVVVCCAGTVVRFATSNASTGVVATPVPLDGSVALGMDSETIIYSPATPCRDSVLSADERPDRVLLKLTESDAGLQYCLRGGPATFGTVTVVLHAHLGSRMLVDAVTGRALAYLAEDDLLRPSPPVAGWDVYAPMANVTTRMAYFGGPGAVVVVENFRAADATGQTRQPGNLAIVQVANGGWHPPNGTPTSPLTVRGHLGLAAAGIIVWTESGRTIAVAASRPIGHSPAPEPPLYAGIAPAPTKPLSTAELLAIAATLTGGPA
jgi:hypothetical protein